ncbi:MAG TPA: aminotransferase class I/II-fold pyridoxal phosphate-dependent enzyme [Candidatus Acidoferrales bacterium]|nr:aminotransferase class I/II-fold pyridoxal phosphate-dependent enzyme [Candidatus Acidoferrales bacterium]
MTAATHSRRDFSRILGQSLAAAIAAPTLPSLKRLDARQSNPMPLGPILLNFNENPYGPSPKARAALADCGSISNRYPDADYRSLMNTLAQKYNLKAENTILGCGSTEILRAADNAFLDPTRNVVAAAPTFEAVLDYARVLHSNAVLIPLTADHRHDLPKMAAACTSKTGVAYVCNPNNPTGTIVTRDEFAAFVQAVPPATLIIVDEAYCDFPNDPRYTSALEFIPAHPNVIVARTFSKIHGMAGMRLGYAIGAREPISRLTQQLLQDNGNAAVLQAALASLADNDHIASCRAQLNGTRDWLCAQLTKDSRPFIPSQANFVMLDLGTDAKPIIEQFRTRNILVGRPFAAMPNFLRVTIGTQPETEAFLAALREISPANPARAAA